MLSKGTHYSTNNIFFPCFTTRNKDIDTLKSKGIILIIKFVVVSYPFLSRQFSSKCTTRRTTNPKSSNLKTLTFY